MLVTRPNIEIARTGRWNASTGEWNCTRSQLADAVRAAKSGKFRNPVLKRGHVDPRFAGDAVVAEDGEPALGQVRNLRLADDGDSLVGDLLVPDWLDDELPATYPSRSIEADLGVETADGEKFELVVSGLALLGVTKPAIQSLAELPERIAASEYTAAMSIAAGFFDEAAHPRGGKGSAAGGKFVAKGSGYAGKDKDGEADTVREVQAELIRLGLLSKDSGKDGGKDGLFGPKTEAAVKEWQKAHGNTPTGKVSDQLLKTLKLAKKGDHGEAQKLADHPAKKPVAKTEPMRKTEPAKKPHPKVKLIKMAADSAAPSGLHVREITTDTVVYADADGRVWAASWSEDGDAVTVGTAAPAVTVYAPLAASAAGVAAHSMALPLYSSRGREVMIESASPQGATSVDVTHLREALGMDENADEDAVLAAATERLKSSTEPPAITQENSTGETPVDSHAQADQERTSEQVVNPAAVEALVAAKVAAALAPIQTEQASLKASTAAYEAKIGELSGELATRKAKEAEDLKMSVLASAAQQGKFAPSARAEWEKSYDESPTVTTRILASIAPGTAVPVSAMGYAGDGNESTDDYAGFEAAFAWGADK